MCPNRRSEAKNSQLCAGEPSHCLVRRTPPASALTHKPPKAFHWTSASENLWLAWSAHAWVDTGASPESAGPPESRHAVTPLAADLKRPSREVGSLTHWSAPLPRQNPILAADTDWPGPLDTHIPRKPTREPSGLRPYHACSPVTSPPDSIDVARAPGALGQAPMAESVSCTPASNPFKIDQPCPPSSS